MLFVGGAIAFGLVVGWLGAENVRRARRPAHKLVGLTQMAIAVGTMAFLLSTDVLLSFLGSMVGSVAVYETLHGCFWRIQRRNS